MTFSNIMYMKNHIKDLFYLEYYVLVAITVGNSNMLFDLIVGISNVL